MNVETYLHLKASEASKQGGNGSYYGQASLVFAPQLEGMLINGRADNGAVDDTLEALQLALTNAVMLSPAEFEVLASTVARLVNNMAGDPAFAIRQLLLRELYPPTHPLVSRDTYALPFSQSTLNRCFRRMSFADVCVAVAVAVFSCVSQPVTASLPSPQNLSRNSMSIEYAPRM